MYAKDTSRKIKSALHARRMQGKYMATTAPFGYQKDEKDHNHLVIDEVTAPVVELIFSIAEEGVGLHTICNRLRKAKVIKPSFYKKEMFERYTDEEKMYDWDTAYVSKILHDPVYAGNLTVAERPTKTMRSKKRQYIPYAEREVIYGTHEPIIEQNRWNNVQKILQSRPPVIGESSSGYDNIFRGVIKCADCGSAMLAKVEQKRKRNNVLDKTFYCCTKYRKFGKSVVSMPVPPPSPGHAARSSASCSPCVTSVLHKGLGLSQQAKTDTARQGPGRAVFRECGYTPYACYVTPPPVPLPPPSVLIKRIGIPKLCAKGWKFLKKRKKIEATLRSRKATSICFR